MGLELSQTGARVILLGNGGRNRQTARRLVRDEISDSRLKCLGQRDERPHLRVHRFPWAAFALLVLAVHIATEPGALRHSLLGQGE